MRSVILLAILLPSAALAQPFDACEPTNSRDLMNCLNGRIARLEAIVGAAPVDVGGAIAPTLCARWHRADHGFRCVLFKPASYSR